MEEGEIGERVAADCEVFLDLAFVDVEEGKLVGFAHPLFFAFFGPLEVKRVQFDIPIPREHQEPS